LIFSIELSFSQLDRSVILEVMTSYLDQLAKEHSFTDSIELHLTPMSDVSPMRGKGSCMFVASAIVKNFSYWRKGPKV